MKFPSLRGTYSEIGNIADSKCEGNFYYSVIKNKPEPQNRCYPISNTDTYTGIIKRSHKKITSITITQQQYTILTLQVKLVLKT